MAELPIAPGDVYIEVEYDYEYKAKDRTITIQQGDCYMLVKKSNGDWWQVRKEEGAKAFYVPAQYVREVRKALMPPPKALHHHAAADVLWVKPTSLDLGLHGRSTENLHQHEARRSSSGHPSPPPRPPQGQQPPPAAARQSHRRPRPSAGGHPRPRRGGPAPSQRGVRHPAARPGAVPGLGASAAGRGRPRPPLRLGRRGEAHQRLRVGGRAERQLHRTAPGNATHDIVFYQTTFTERLL